MIRTFNKAIQGIDFVFTEHQDAPTPYYSVECNYQNQNYILRFWFKEDEGIWVQEIQNLPTKLHELDFEIHNAITDNIHNI